MIVYTLTNHMKKINQVRFLKPLAFLNGEHLQQSMIFFYNEPYSFHCKQQTCNNLSFENGYEKCPSYLTPPSGPALYMRSMNSRSWPSFMVEGIQTYFPGLSENRKEVWASPRQLLFLLGIPSSCRTTRSFELSSKIYNSIQS